MIDLYELDAFGQWTGATRQICEGEGCADPWVRAKPPPQVGEGEAVVWAIGKWFGRPRLSADEVVSPQITADGA